VRAGAVRLIALTNADPDWITPLALDSSAHVRAEVCWALVSLTPKDKGQIVTRLFDRADEPWLRYAALAAAGDGLDAILTNLASTNPERVAEIRKLLSARSGKSAKAPDFGAAAPRPAAIAQYQPALTLHGDPAKGRAIFDARCTVCHRFAGHGNSVGPDLDSAHQAGPEKLLGNILEPSREITAGYSQGIVETKSGETLAGVLANESAVGVELHLPGGAQRIIRTADIAKITRPTRSLMPDGIETGLSVQEMADLLEYLSTSSP
jgi:putative heme-binding domain-containing protein